MNMVTPTEVIWEGRPVSVAQQTVFINAVNSVRAHISMHLCNTLLSLATLNRWPALQIELTFEMFFDPNDKTLGWLYGHLPYRSIEKQLLLSPVRDADEEIVIPPTLTIVFDGIEIHTNIENLANVDYEECTVTLHKASLCFTTNQLIKTVLLGYKDGDPVRISDVDRVIMNL